MKPFLKWAGGKTKLIPQIEPYIPNHIDSYTEPFLGGGAMLLYILETHPELQSCTANDINHRLITTWRMVQQHPKELITELNRLKTEYLAASDRTAYYLEKRNLFNTTTDSMDIGALFIFLNHTCFNGLYRENKKGEFNVPHGNYPSPSIYDEEQILGISELIRNTKFVTGDYKQLHPKGFMYLDPPYRPIKNNSFTSYSKDGFGDEQQIELADFIKTLTDNGASFVLSNSFSDDGFFQGLYSDYNITVIEAPRNISTKSARTEREICVYQ